MICAHLILLIAVFDQDAQLSRLTPGPSEKAIVGCPFQAPNLIHDPDFGLSTATLAQCLSGGSSNPGGLNPLFQIGGPRTVQLVLRVHF